MRTVNSSILAAGDGTPTSWPKYALAHTFDVRWPRCHPQIVDSNRHAMVQRSEARLSHQAHEFFFEPLVYTWPVKPYHTRRLYSCGQIHA